MTTLSVISSSRLAGASPDRWIVAATADTRSDWANWRADRFTLMTSDCADG